MFPNFWSEGTCYTVEEMLLWVGFIHRKSYFFYFMGELTEISFQ